MTGTETWLYAIADFIKASAAVPHVDKSRYEVSFAMDMDSLEIEQNL